ncbi:MAG TPA: substrate-binding domain-containing protein [Thermoplasmata archaeon]|nr:substrate-binding domain-containing protein [Thermoplasmata archaeon]
MSTQSPSGATSTDSLSAPERRRSGTMRTGIAIAIAVILLIVGIGAGYAIGYSLKGSSSSSGSSSNPIQLTETGSSLLYPLFNSYWFPNYTAIGQNVILSAASTGSGAGQSSAENALVNIGASDAYLANASATNLINFPVAISSQLIYYNLPAPLNGVHLNLNGTIMALIYEGDITTWNNPTLEAAQSPTVAAELSAMSSQTIYPVKRTDSSGDTFIFTSYCSAAWSGFPYPVSTSGLSGDNIPNMQTGTGNAGVVSTLGKQAGSIGYVGISYTSSASAAGLQYAALGDNLTVVNGQYASAAADYILPSAQNISYDANLGLQRLDFGTYGLAVSLILGGSYLGAITLTHGGGGTNPTATSPDPYPIVNLEYTLFKTAPVSGSNVVTATTLAATVAFMHWALSTGNYGTNGQSPSAWISAVGFVPLTPEVIGYDLQELATVSY